MKMYREPSGTLQIVIWRNKLYLKAALNVWNKICVFLTAENKTFSRTRLSSLGSPQWPNAVWKGPGGSHFTQLSSLDGKKKVLMSLFVCLLSHSGGNVKNSWAVLQKHPKNPKQTKKEEFQRNMKTLSTANSFFKVRLPMAAHQASPPCLAHLRSGCSPVCSPLLSVNHFTSLC